MEDPLKSISAGITEGIITGFHGRSRVEHISEDGGSLEISGNYSSTTKHTGIHVGNGAQIKVSGNAKIIQQD